MRFIDRLTNLITGLGTARDKGVGASHVLHLRTDHELIAAYRTSWAARKAVDIVPFDMLREWRAWQADEAQVEKLEAAEAALGYRTKLMAALVRARLLGGACILIGDGRADQGSELRPDSIRQGGISFLHVLGKREITAGALVRDPLSLYYGEPSYYEVRGVTAQTRIHPSRVVRFVGAPYPEDLAVVTDGWGDSILQAVLDAIDQAGSSLQHIAAMIPEAKQDIISVPGLADALSTEESTKKLTDRFAGVAQLKSMFGLILLDKPDQGAEGETYQQKTLSFQTLPDVARLFLQVAAGAADIPVTRFLGQSPSGLNATGESDLRNYQDHVAARQRVELTPAIMRLDEMLIRHALGARPPGVWYTWNPLYQPTEKEKADVAKTKAETAQVYANTGLIPDTVLAEGVKGALINSDTFPGIEAAYDAHKGELVQEPDDDALLPDGQEPGGNVVPFRRAVNDAAPRTLYVSRKLTNAADLVAWAKDQGFASLMPAGEMHVTIAYSRQALDWMKVGATWQGAELKVDAGGPRIIERFGEAVVLLFASSDLSWRHREIIEAGASHDHPEFQPHVTFTYDPGDVDLTKVQAYNGPLVLGPEIFAEVDEGWRAKVEAAE